ncbi:MAG: hypothetical protein ACKVP0_24915 [Pirellulaceae bacterium]
MSEYSCVLGANVIVPKDDLPLVAATGLYAGALRGRALSVG